MEGIIKRTVFLSFIYVVSGNMCKDGNCANAICKLGDSMADLCHSKQEAFVLPDFDCDCCGHCAPVKDVLNPKDPKECPKDICPYVSCRPESVEYCKSDQVLVPYDGECFCCPTCMDKRPDYVYNEPGSPHQDDDDETVIFN